MSTAVSVVWFLGGVGMSPPWGVRGCFGLCTARSFVYTHCFWGFWLLAFWLLAVVGSCVGLLGLSLCVGRS